MEKLSTKDRIHRIRKDLAHLEVQHCIHTPSSEKLIGSISESLDALERMV